MVTKILDSGGEIKVEFYPAAADAAVTVTSTTLTDTRGFTPSGAVSYWAGARVYCGPSNAAIGSSDATTLTLDEAWSVGTPEQGLGYVIIRDYGSQYRYANQIYTLTTSGATETLIWAMPTLSLPDSSAGATGFIEATVIANNTTGTAIPEAGRWKKEAVFTWLRSDKWQSNAASFIDVGLDRSHKDANMIAVDCSLRLRTSDFYPTLYVTGTSGDIIYWQATIEFSVFSVA